MGGTEQDEAVSIGINPHLMKVLVVGNGAREHTIAWKLSQSLGLTELRVAPGNPGTAEIATNVPIDSTDVGRLLRYAQDEKIDLTVVGPEAPLAAGIADRFDEAGLLLFGPTKAAARIDTSKSFAKDLMLRHGVPTGQAETFDDYQHACQYIEGRDPPIVVKADGLAAGKGVVVAETREAAQDVVRLQMIEKQFGAAGERLLIEEYLEGPELSVFAFVDGQRMSPLVAACDYKRAGDGDTGSNTGGMGAYSPPPDDIWNDDMDSRVRTEIMEPVVAALEDQGSPYKGALYAGLMLTREGPKVIEFNCRLGDPEAQVVLPRLKTDLLEVMIRAAQGDLSGITLDWDPRACVGVVVASGGYPGAYSTGYTLDGLDKTDHDITIFHAGTKAVKDEGAPPGEKIVSDGGRVLTVTALGPTLDEARRKVYANAARIRFADSFYRRDIALLP